MSKIEKKAVRYVSELFENSDYLSCKIEVEDSHPVTDGVVSVYNKPPNTSGQHDIKSLIGTINVQVKGTERKAFGKYKRFNLTVDELRAIQNSGGLLFVVVFIDKNKSNSQKAYYTYLYPLEVTRIFESLKTGQKSKGLLLQELPTNPESVLGIVNLALEKQNSQTLVNVEDLKGGFPTQWRVITDKPIDFTVPSWLGGSGTPAVIKAGTPSGAFLPTDGFIKLIPEDYSPQPLGEVISSGGVAFSDSKRRRISSAQVEVAVSPAIRLTFDFDKSVLNLEYKPSKDFFEYYREINFLTGWGRNGFFKVGKEDFHVHFPKAKWLSDAEASLQVFKEIHEFFKFLGVDENRVKMTDLASDEVMESLEPVVRTALRLKMPLTEAQGAIQHEIRIGEERLKLLFHSRGEGESRHWECCSFSRPPSDLKIGGEIIGGRENFTTFTAFELYSVEDFETILNLNLDSVVSEYSLRVSSEYIRDFGLATAKKLLLAGDKFEDRRREFLAAATKLVGWIGSKYPEDKLVELYRWQIEYRLRVLQSNAIERIRDLRMSLNLDCEENIALYAAYCFLLDDEKEGLAALKKLSQEGRSNFESFPIAYLYQIQYGDYELPKMRDEERWKEYNAEVWREMAEEGLKISQN